MDHEDVKLGDGDDGPQAMRLSKCLDAEVLTCAADGSPRINPFHLLSHPDNDENLPPLPPHLQKLASGSDDNVEFMIKGCSAGDTILANGEPPIHVTKVKQDYVEITNGSSPETYGARKMIAKVNEAIKKDYPVHPAAGLATVSSGPTMIMQGPPPSPPISESEDTLGSEGSHPSPIAQSPDTVPVVPGPSMFTANLSSEPTDIAFPGHMDTGLHLAIPPGTASTDRRVSTSSISSRTGSLAVVRAARAAQQRNNSPNTFDSDRSSVDLQPEDESAPYKASAPRMTRRSTNPTINPTRSPLLHSQSTLSAAPPRSRTTVPGLDGSALDSDILAHTEIIRRERLERRQKKAGAEQSVPVSELKAEPKVKEDPKVMVGNLIGEDHVNYVLMYNMLTGIRIGVSCTSTRRTLLISGLALSSQNQTASHRRRLCCSSQVLLRYVS